MNILREFRRVKKKSMATRVRLITMFSVILIINTYAWWNVGGNISLKAIEGEVTSWDVAYYVGENEILDQTVVFTIDELYPGMPEHEDVVHIYNMGKTSSTIEYRLISVKVLGEEILDQLQTNGEIETVENTTTLFTDDTTYPFSISYTYDKNRLDDQYVDDETTPQSVATFRFNTNWAYEATGTENQKVQKDLLDTTFGKQAYQYYQNEENNPEKAIEITVRIKSQMLREAE